MFLCEDLAIKIVFSILFLSSTGNENKSMNAEHGFVSSFATNNNIVSDVNQGQSKLQKSITDSFAESCPFYLNTSKQCFPTLKKNNSSLELYNLTEQAKKLNLTAERENLRLFGKPSRKKLFCKTFFDFSDKLYTSFVLFSEIVLIKSIRSETFDEIHCFYQTFLCLAYNILIV